MHSTRFQFAVAIIAVLTGTFFASLLPVRAETGTASWYGNENGQDRRADGRPYDPSKVSCAHRTIPLRTWIRVTVLSTGRSIVCQVLDRGPYKRGRVLDVSTAAARQLGIVSRGTARVRIDLLNR